MRRSGLLAPLLLLPLVGYADDLSQQLLKIGFVEADVPSIGSDRWHAANESFPSFFVEVGNQLTIRRSTSEEEDRQQIIFEGDSVKYIGVDHGEWGGGLYLNEWSENGEPLLEGNIKSLVPIDKDLYVIEGLAHLTMSEGSVYVIRDYAHPKEPELFVELPDAPAATYVDYGENGLAQIIIVGAQSLMKLTLGKRLDVVAQDTFWAALYPSSVVKYGDRYVIGIRSGVAVVSPGAFREKIRYFTPR